MFERFQKFMPRVANRYGIGKELEAVQICHDFSTLIPEIFQGKIDPQKYIQPAYVKDGLLVVKTDSPAWSQEVIMRKEKIIKEMNIKAGKTVIKRLKTTLSK